MRFVYQRSFDQLCLNPLHVMRFGYLLAIGHPLARAWRSWLRAASYVADPRLRPTTRDCGLFVDFLCVAVVVAWPDLVVDFL